MGLWDIITSDPTSYVKKASIKRWSQAVQTQDPEDLEEQPFADPHYYSDSESDIESALEEKSEIVEDEDRTGVPGSIESGSAPIEPTAVQNVVRYRPMSQGPKFNYGEYKVAYTTWQDPFEAAAKQSTLPENYAVSPYAVAAASDGGYKRVFDLQPKVFNIPGVEEEEPSEDESDEGSEDDGIPQLNSDTRIDTELTDVAENGTAYAIASSGPSASSSGVSISSESDEVESLTHVGGASTTTTSRTPRRRSSFVKRFGSAGIAIVRSRSSSPTPRCVYDIRVGFRAYEELKERQKEKEEGQRERKAKAKAKREGGKGKS